MHVAVIQRWSVALPVLDQNTNTGVFLNTPPIDQPRNIPMSTKIVLPPNVPLPKLPMLEEPYKFSGYHATALKWYGRLFGFLHIHIH